MPAFRVSVSRSRAQAEARRPVHRRHLAQVGGPGQEGREVRAAGPGGAAPRGLVDRRPGGLDEVQGGERSGELDLVLGGLLGGRVGGRRRCRLACRPRGDVDERHGQGQPGPAGRRLLRLPRRARQRGRGGDGAARVRKAHQLYVLAGQQQLGQRVLAVELVVVQVDAAGDDPAGGQRAVDPPGAVLRLQRADQAAHGRAESEHLARRARQHGGFHGLQGLELVADRAVQRPHRAVRVVRGAGQRVPAGQQRRRGRRVRGVRGGQRAESVAVEQQGPVPLRGHVGDPGRAVGERAGEVPAGRCGHGGRDGGGRGGGGTAAWHGAAAATSPWREGRS